MKKILDISWVGPSSVCAQCMDFTPVVHDDLLYGDGKVVAREITVHCTNETLCSRLVERFSDLRRLRVVEDEKKRGRPRAKNPKDHIVHARLTKKEYDALNEVCAANDMSLTDVILTGLHAICVLSEK